MLTSDETATPCVDCGAEMQGIYVKIIGKHFTHKRCDECDMIHRRKTTEQHLSLYRARIPTIMRELCGVPPHFTGSTIAQLPRSLSKAAQFPPKGPTSRGLQEQERPSRELLIFHSTSMTIPHRTGSMPLKHCHFFYAYRSS